MSCRDSNMMRFISMYNDFECDYEDGLTDKDVMEQHKVTKDILQVFKMSSSAREFGELMADINEIFNPDRYYTHWCSYESGIAF